MIKFPLSSDKQVMHKWLLGVLFYQNWLAYDVLPAPWNFTEQGKLRFSGLAAPTSENNYAFCQVRNLDVNTSYISLKLVWSTVKNVYVVITLFLIPQEEMI